MRSGGPVRSSSIVMESTRLQTIRCRGVSKTSPCVRMTATWSRRARSVTAMPLSESRAPTREPIAPAPKHNTCMLLLQWLPVGDVQLRARGEALQVRAVAVDGEERGDHAERDVLVWLTEAPERNRY